MSIIGRFFVDFFALVLSIIAAGLALAIGVMVPDVVTLTADPLEHFLFFSLQFFATGLVGAYAFLPAVALVVIGEIFDLRSIFFYTIGGAAIAALSYYTSDFSLALESTTDLPPVAFGLQLVLAAGIIAGFVYWLIAGRRAGLWKKPAASPLNPSS